MPDLYPGTWPHQQTAQEGSGIIAGCDSSSFHPSLAQVKHAHDGGVRLWAKYLPGPGIYSGDHKSDYDTLKAGGMTTLAFCSGYADPGQMKTLGQQWGVDHICLDVEGRGLRPDGGWVQGWLDASGAGLYGNPPVFANRHAPFFIMANYQGQYPNYRDPRATWDGPPPSVPHGWQWAGSVDAFGGGVDRMWLDDWFATAQQEADDLTPEQAAQLADATSKIDMLFQAFQGFGGPPHLPAGTMITDIFEGPMQGFPEQPALDPEGKGRGGLKQQLDRIEAAVKKP